MGACSSQDQKKKETLHDAFAKTGMQVPWGGETENPFEVDLYKSINLFRHNPAKFAVHFKDLKK